MLKRTLYSVITFTVLVVALLFASYQWLLSSIASDTKANPDTTPQQLSYLSHAPKPSKGRIIAVVTSTDTMGDDKKTGYELTELARAYYVFQANGFEVDIASIKGGTPPVVIDKGDMNDFDYAFLNDTNAQHKVTHSLKISDVEAMDYDAIFFVGGKGAMFDFPNNKPLQSLVKTLYENNKVISAVCHGPAALVNVRLSNGSPLIAGKQVSSFTNSEELTLITNAEAIFPFLLQTKLMEQQADFVAGPDYVSQVSVDSNLITGQNPWSVWEMAEQVVSQLGYQPIMREITDEENAAQILKYFYLYGIDKATVEAKRMIDNQLKIKKELIAMHGIFAAMKGELGNMWSIFSILHQINKLGSDA